MRLVTKEDGKTKVRQEGRKEGRKKETKSEKYQSIQRSGLFNLFVPPICFIPAEKLPLLHFSPTIRLHPFLSYPLVDRFVSSSIRVDEQYFFYTKGYA